MALFPLPILVEILINGTWKDVSSYVYQRDNIVITAGSQTFTPGQMPNASQMTLTFNNNDGRFSPNNTSGAFYPYLTRNIQIRVSVVNATSSSSNTYTGYRFWGEIPDFPPTMSDPSGNDAFVPIQANGPMRRLLNTGGRGGALQRYYSTLTGPYAPVAYWPCEEDPNSNQIQAGLSGGSPMTITGTPTFKAITNFNGGAPMGILNGSTWDGLSNSLGGGSGNDVFSAPGSYFWIAQTATVDMRNWAPGGGADNGWRGTGGGAGEFARESALVVTPGKAYPVTILAGGQGGDTQTNNESNGATAGTQTFAGDVVNVVAHGGHGGSGAGPGNGGTGSTNSEHHDGGAGGANPSDFQPGAGGGAAAGAGSSGAGAAGSNPTSGSPGNGGTGDHGGGNGGKGGTVGHIGNDGGTPGAGGGGGSTKGSGPFTNYAGGNGAPGQMQFIYTPPAGGASTNVLRFVLIVPKHGGNPGKVLARWFTGSTVLNRVEVAYGAGGVLALHAFNASSTLTLDSGNQSWGVDGIGPVMVSIEFQNSGANVNWAFRAIIPGSSTLLGSVNGSVTTAACGNVSECVVAPNADITKTAMGHFSIQYALISLRKLSRRLNGHITENTIDRFTRLCAEEAMEVEPGYNETADHWGFETGTQSWVGVNASLTNPTTTFTPASTDLCDLYNAWPPEGTHSLLLTASGAGSPSAHAPSGTSGQNVNVGDQVSVAVELYTVVAISNLYVGLQWFQSSGAACTHAEDDSADYVTVAGEMTTLTMKATAPTGAAFFCVVVGNHGTLAANTLIYVDNVRVSPRMGVQTRKKLHEFLEEVRDLEQGIMRESRILWGLGLKTRISLINQSPAVTLDYSQGMVGGPNNILAPIVDTQNVKNDVTVRRRKGSQVRVTLDSGTMSTQEPPLGTGRHRHHIQVAAEADQQIAALATHLLNLGTVTDERYPEIFVELGRCGIPGHPLAPLMSAVAQVEMGSFVKITNLAAWYPSTTAQQMVIGYTETLNTFLWNIAWSCWPISPWNITIANIRRW